ncbi:MAG: response regulator [Myxococcales bacterium]|jgi:DNA-binding NtrC family response regulator
MAGEELLIADSADRDREGLRQLFERAGYVCTACGDEATAQDLVQRKFFPAAVIDLDFGGPGRGLDFARRVQKVSEPTRIVLLCGRRSFEDAVDAHRLGVVDIVTKRPDQIQHLQAAVRRAVDRYTAGGKDSTLMREVADVLEESFKIMLSMARKVYGSSGSQASLAMKPAILLIDEDQAFLKEMAGKLADKPWEVSIELSGGSGLDRASTFSFQIVAVRDQLMDLPGPMVLKSAQEQQPQMLGLVYSFSTGQAERYQQGRPTKSMPCDSADGLVAALGSLVQELSAMREERRYMQAFRSEHGSFVKRFAELKVRIDGMLE